MRNPDVESYSTLDLRFAWRPRPGVELSVVGQNLLGRHVEYVLMAPYASEFRPSVFVKGVVRF
jgi:iron complex outermembrane recepter protein